jgi:3-deoxy-D-manno-octulosonate 8-phosphate phosphatase (KDO 8-P phosphatase)
MVTTAIPAPLIRALVLDVDGVLTDGGIYLTDAGDGLRRFHVHDGFALRWFQELGGVVIICSGKTSPAVAARARELRISHVLQGSRDKLAELRGLLDTLGWTLAETAMIGDDLPDLPVLRACGLPIAVANAVAEVRAAACWTTRRAGGAGAVREAVEWLLRRDGRWDQVLAHYGGSHAGATASERTGAKASD